MEELFAGLSGAVSSTPSVAIAAAAAWGVLSVALSPCHLVGIPLLVAFIARRSDRSIGDAWRIASAFALGVAITIAVVAGITIAAGRIAGDLGPISTYIVAGVFVLVGLHLAGVIEIPMPSGSTDESKADRGTLGAFLLGLAFGSTLGPCTFAFMAPVLAAAFGSAHVSAWLAAGLVLAFGVGHCGTIAVAGGSAGASAGLVQRWLRYSNRSRAIERLRVASGVVIILSGLYLLYSA